VMAPQVRVLASADARPVPPITPRARSTCDRYRSQYRRSGRLGRRLCVGPPWGIVAAGFFPRDNTPLPG